MKKVILFSILIIFILIFIAVCALTYTKQVSNSLKNSFFRLHIIANSDSLADQNLKLKIRDSVLEYMKQISNNTMSKEDALLIAQNNISTISNIVQQTINNEGFNYTSNLKIGTFYFPTKKYANISLPAGYYDGLKIEIGEAEGKNWWCSLFPPLCFIDISSGVIDSSYENKLEYELDKESFLIITENSKPIKLKFKVLELLSK